MLNNNNLSAIFIALSGFCALLIPSAPGQAEQLLSPRFLAETYGVANSRAASAVEPLEAAPEQDLWARIGSQLAFQDLLAYQQAGTSGAQRVKAERDWYAANPAYLTRVSRRARPYLYHVVEEVERRHMPMELALLPIMESAYDPLAYSHGRAAGLWQIIPGTGQELGLTQDWWVDDRRDVRASTDAALDYLAQLGERFDGDWLKALAAYNAGPGRIARAERRNRNKGLATDFWSLDLPRETRNYVPRLLALAELVSDPERYGQQLEVVANAPYFDVVDTGGQIELGQVARLAKLDPDTVRSLNPAYNRWATSPEGPHELLLPVGVAPEFEAALADLKPSERVTWRRYSIRRGDTLSTIASRHDTEVAVLQGINGIKGSRIVVGDTLMIPSGGVAAASIEHQPMVRKLGYRVRSGDSLARIANKFKLSVDDILGWNEELRHKKYIHPGQRLTLYVDITDS